ncbi:MAG: pyrroloquinoline quinone biosynthesis protein PqqB, partial [Cytophagia bacterium]|nr:pyrroloquinoline quinone biosynthesis protein PqqB [Cytophagia bacterium]
HLGKEVMGTSSVPVFAMPKMKTFLEENGPWSQLVKLNNISLKPTLDSTFVELSGGVSVMPFTVPHRDEYSETVGYKIKVQNQSVVFIPDIDKWNKWDVDIREVVKANDLILIDASFYQDGELKGRDMSLIPHPFTKESMELFKDLSEADKAKVYFIHANHTNPILDLNSTEYEEVIKAGFHIADQGQIFSFDQ